ncbi:MAG: MFS transporter, partial [Pseudohongiellaceae bacterium]
MPRFPNLRSDAAKLSLATTHDMNQPASRLASSPTSGLTASLIAMLAVMSALGPASMQILLPALPIIRESFVVSTAVAQLTLSLSMFSIAMATLIYGPLSDRFGRKPILLIGCGVTFVGSLF